MKPGKTGPHPIGIIMILDKGLIQYAHHCHNNPPHLNLLPVNFLDHPCPEAICHSHPDPSTQPGIKIRLYVGTMKNMETWHETARQSVTTISIGETNILIPQGHNSNL